MRRDAGLLAPREADSDAAVDRYNRLHSIAEDAAFIGTRVKAAYPDLPIVGQSAVAAPPSRDDD